MAPLDPDLALRQAATSRVLELRDAFDDIVPRDALLGGFHFRGERIAFSSFQKGIHRARQMQGAAALSVLTAAPKPGQPPPYEDELDEEAGVILYHYRAGSVDQADNRALAAAHELQSPLIYFKGMAPGQYLVVAPVFVRQNDPSQRGVLLDGVVHIARRVREESDGPMLREGIQGFHGAGISKPARAAEHPDPERLAARFEVFETAAA